MPYRVRCYIPPRHAEIDEAPELDGSLALIVGPTTGAKIRDVGEATSGRGRVNNIQKLKGCVTNIRRHGGSEQLI